MPVLQLNPELDRAALAREFAAKGRVQVRNVLTQTSAEAIRDVLQHRTPWCLAWQVGRDGPHLIKAEQLKRLPAAEASSIQARIAEAIRGDAYAFAYFSYPLVQAYLERWQPGSPHEALLEQLNSPDFLDLVREVTDTPEIVKMDGQATLYGPGQLLAQHDDDEPERGRRVAYVLSLTLGEWRPEWGGYLNFYDEEWDVEEAMRPRFNALNLFRVPQVHAVTQVSAFAPVGRYAVTGWARDR